MKTYLIKDPIYNALYKVYIGDDCQQMVDKSGVRTDKPFWGVVGEVDGNLAICFLRDELPISINVIAHEAYHGMYFLFSSLNIAIDTEEHEHVAFYVGWLTEQLWNIALKYERIRETSTTE